MSDKYLNIRMTKQDMWLKPTLKKAIEEMESRGLRSVSMTGIVIDAVTDWLEKHDIEKEEV